MNITLNADLMRLAHQYARDYVKERLHSTYRDALSYGMHMAHYVRKAQAVVSAYMVEYEHVLGILRASKHVYTIKRNGMMCYASEHISLAYACVFVNSYERIKLALAQSAYDASACRCCKFFLNDLPKQAAELYGE